MMVFNKTNKALTKKTQEFPKTRHLSMFAKVMPLIAASVIQITTAKNRAIFKMQILGLEFVSSVDLDFFSG